MKDTSEEIDNNLPARLTIARRYLTRTQKRLDLASVTPEVKSLSRPAVARATFIIRQEDHGGLHETVPATIMIPKIQHQNTADGCFGGVAGQSKSLQLDEKSSRVVRIAEPRTSHSRSYA